MLHEHIHRTYIPGGTYFVTSDVRYHRPFFEDQHLARIVEESIWHERTVKFIMYAYVVMPDHLHLLLQPIKGNISRIMQSIKSNSTREINRYLRNHPHSRKSALSAMGGENVCRFQWQQPFYDHVIKDEDDFRNHVEYIRYNPVKAWLYRMPEEYPYLFVDEEVIRRIFGGG